LTALRCYFANLGSLGWKPFFLVNCCVSATTSKRHLAYTESMNRHFLRTATALPVLLAGPAIAADMPLKAAPPAPAPAFSWTGFYVGLNAGGTWARSDAETSVNCNVPPARSPYLCDSLGNGSATAAGVNAAGSGTISASGFTGGVQAGYNWQGPNLVYGLETDFGAFHLRGSRQGTAAYAGLPAAPAAFGGTFTIGSSIATDWLYTLRGRVGLPVTPGLLAYATGGLAVTRLSVNNSLVDSAGAAESAGTATTKAGWVVGGGFEYALVNNWSIKAEYLFMDFGKVTATGTIINAFAGGYSQGISTSSDLTAQVARVGVNRRF
jgi:outer membrane immunogenic protein